MHNLKFIIIAFVLLLNIACSSFQIYEGPKYPPEKKVTIYGKSGYDIFSLGVTLNVCEFDNIVFDSCKTNIEFLPGIHRVVIKYTRYGLSESKKEIVKEFNAGEMYKLKVGLEFEKEGFIRFSNAYPTLRCITKYNIQTKKNELCEAIKYNDNIYKIR